MPNSKNFWKKVEEEYKGWQDILEDYVVPSKTDLERYRVSRSSKGKVHSNLSKNKASQGAFVAPGDNERHNLLLQSLDEVRDVKLHEIIRQGIVKRAVTEDFFWAWSHYQRHASILVALQIVDHEAVSKFYEIGTQDSQIYHTYVYAHWMYHRWAKDSRDGKRQEKGRRGLVEDALAQEIHDINIKQLLSPEDRAILGRLVSHDKGKPYLQGKILNFSARKICDLVENGKIRQEELPPIGY